MRSETPFLGDISPLQRQEFSPSPTVTVSSKVILGLWRVGSGGLRAGVSLQGPRPESATPVLCMALVEFTVNSLGQ